MRIKTIENGKIGDRKIQPGCGLFIERPGKPPLTGTVEYSAGCVGVIVSADGTKHTITDGMRAALIKPPLKQPMRHDAVSRPRQMGERPRKKPMRLSGGRIPR